MDRGEERQDASSWSVRDAAATPRNTNARPAPLRHDDSANFNTSRHARDLIKDLKYKASILSNSKGWIISVSLQGISVRIRWLL